MHKLQCLMALAILCFGPSPAWAGEVYGNARFGFFIEVPEIFTVAGPEPENGDGRAFRTEDSSAELTVSGGWIVADNFAAQMEQDKGFDRDAGWQLTYESKANPNAVSYSGTKGGQIFYVREITSCAGAAHAGYRLEYPVEQKAKFDSVIKLLNKTLRAGEGNCG